MLPHLNIKVDFSQPIVREILNFMLDEKNSIKTITGLTGKVLGHDINWRLISKHDSRHILGYLTFEFDNEANKVLFILKLL